MLVAYKDALSPSTNLTMRALNTDTVIARATALHGTKYGYDKVVYRNKRTKIIVTCPIHGDFEQFPLDHAVAVRGYGCTRCGHQEIAARRRFTKADFVRKAREVHGNRYIYEQTIYQGARQKVTIACSEHGAFSQTADSHLQGIGCPTCGHELCGQNQRLSPDRFIAACSATHGNKYDYSKTEYTRSVDKIIITCPKHGDFTQVANAHQSGIGCRKCSCGGFSNGAIEWLEYRARQDGIYIQHAGNDGEYTAHDKDDRLLKFDGYCFQTNTVYEYEGSYFHGDPKLYDPDEVNAVTKQSFGHMWQKTMDRLNRIEAMGYNVCYITSRELDLLKKAKFFDKVRSPRSSGLFHELVLG